MIKTKLQKEVRDKIQKDSVTFDVNDQKDSDLKNLF